MAADFPGSLFSSAGSIRDGTLTQSEWIHLIEEVEAIEAALGVNLSKVDHVLFATTTAVTVQSTTTETNLITFSVPANTLNADGRGLRIRAAGLTGATSNNKTIKFLFGAASVSSSAVALNATSWFADVTILRSAANAQQIGGLITRASDGSLRGVTASGTETDTGAITAKFSAIPATSSANDSITQNWMTVESI
jgi:hypothetical protein